MEQCNESQSISKTDLPKMQSSKTQRRCKSNLFGSQTQTEAGIILKA